MDLIRLKSNIYDVLSSGNFYYALEMIRVYVETHQDRNDTIYKLDQLESEMELSCQWWKNGDDKPEDDNMLNTYFIPALSRIWDDYMLLDWMTANNDYLLGQRNRVRGNGRDWSWGEIRKRLEGYVTNIAVMQLQRDIDSNLEEKLDVVYNEQKKYRQQVFVYVLTELRLRDSDRQELEELLITPTVDNIDQRMIITAMTLNGLVTVDPMKLRILLDVYSKSLDPFVRQYAFIGLMLMLPGRDYPTTKDIAKRIAELINTDDEMREELEQLQIQLEYCESADKDSSEFQKTMVPEIMKNSNFKKTENGIEIVDEDPMYDILGRSNAEKRMEEIEKHMRSYEDKRDKGVDIFFHGFKQMKFYPFFTDLTNWLTPFYSEHPDIKDAMEKIRRYKTIYDMVMGAPICDNDKYSFVFAFSNMMDRLPKELMDQIPANEGKQQTWMIEPAVIRRNYLQSLYRFFELFPYKTSFVNPFSEDSEINRSYDSMKMSLVAANDVFENTRFCDNMLDLMQFYFRRGKEETIYSLLDSFGKENDDSFDYCYILALLESTNNFKYDDTYIKRCLEMKPDSVKVMKLYARCLFKEKKYGEAKSLYRQLMDLQEQNMKWAVSYAVCCINLSEYDEALKVLFKLNYEYEDDVIVAMNLAKTLFLVGRADEAERLLDKMGKNDDKEYQLLVGSCLWVQKKREKAVDVLALVDYKLTNAGNFGVLSSTFNEYLEDYQDTMKEKYHLAPEEFDIMCHNIWKRLKAKGIV